MAKTKIYYASTEWPECAGMLDKDGNVLGEWAGNDACWDGGYFDGFLDALGFTIVYNNSKYEKIFEQYLRDKYGDDFFE